MKKVYKFDNTRSMLDLFQDVQSKIYWESTFYYEDESIPYRYLWEYCSEAYDNGAVEVVIDNDEVKFNYEGGEDERGEDQAKSE